jgi:WD40 repeat protein
MRVLPTLRYSDQRPAVRYGARGESLVVCFHPWELYRWDWREADEAALCASYESGPQPWRRLLACFFVPGGLAFLRANGFLPESADLPPRITDARKLSKFKIFGQHERFVPQAFRPDGRAYLYWSDSAAYKLRLCDLAGKTLVTYDVPGSLQYGDYCFSSDGSLVALRGWSPSVFLYDAVSGGPLGELEHPREVWCIVFSPCGPLLATSVERTVPLWDAAGRRCLKQFRSFRRYAEALAFSPDGRLLAAGSREGRVRLWDTKSYRELADLDWGQGEVYDLAFAPNGQTAAAACADAVVVWDVDV